MTLEVIQKQSIDLPLYSEVLKEPRVDQISLDIRCAMLYSASGYPCLDPQSSTRSWTVTKDDPSTLKEHTKLPDLSSKLEQ